MEHNWSFLFSDIQECSFELPFKSILTLRSFMNVSLDFLSYCFRKFIGFYGEFCLRKMTIKFIFQFEPEHLWVHRHLRFQTKFWWQVQQVHSIEFYCQMDLCSSWEQVFEKANMGKQKIQREKVDRECLNNVLMGFFIYVIVYQLIL